MMLILSGLSGEEECGLRLRDSKGGSLSRFQKSARLNSSLHWND